MKSLPALALILALEVCLIYPVIQPDLPLLLFRDHNSLLLVSFLVPFPFTSTCVHPSLSSEPFRKLFLTPAVWKDAFPLVFLPVPLSFPTLEVHNLFHVLVVTPRLGTP